MKLSPDDLSRLIDALEGTAHLDESEEERDHTDGLIKRLTTEFMNSPLRQTDLFQ